MSAPGLACRGGRERLATGLDAGRDAREQRLVRSEALVMIAVMRQNARFRADAGGEHRMSGGSSDGSEHPLIEGLNCIRRWPTAAASSSRDRLAPFVDLITSPETPGMITGAALMSVGRLLQGGVVSSAMDLAFLVEGVLACKFEQSDPGALQ